MKACSRCGFEKFDSEFRWRYDKRMSPPCKYLNSTCKKCDSEAQQHRVSVVKDTEEYKQKNKQRVKLYREREYEKVIQKDKIRRQGHDHKQMVREYRERNKEKIYEQEKITKRRYHEKHRDNLTDQYVAGRIIQKTGLAKGEIPQELISIGRLNILLKREIKKKSNGKTTK